MMTLLEMLTYRVDKNTPPPSSPNDQDFKSSYRSPTYWLGLASGAQIEQKCRWLTCTFRNTMPIKHWTRSYRRSNKSKAVHDALAPIFLCCSAMDSAQLERCPCLLQPSRGPFYVPSHVPFRLSL